MGFYGNNKVPEVLWVGKGPEVLVVVRLYGRTMQAPADVQKRKDMWIPPLSARISPIGLYTSGGGNLHDVCRDCLKEVSLFGGLAAWLRVIVVCSKIFFKGPQISVPFINVRTSYLTGVPTLELGHGIFLHPGGALQAPSILAPALPKEA